MNLREVSFKTEDNITIKANYYKKKNADSVIIIAPGWCMTKDSKAFIEISEFFNQYYSVLTIDFRGHGKSRGFYTFGAKEVLDLEAAIYYLSDYKNIYIAGFSLGAMTASIYAAKENCRLDKLILVSVPYDFSKIENQMYKKEAWIETFRKFELKRFLSIRPSFIIHKKIKPIDIVDKIKAPTLFIAGKLDPTVHYEHTEKMYEKAVCKKKLEIFEKGIHAEDIFLHYKKEFETLCLNWLQ